MAKKKVQAEQDTQAAALGQTFEQIHRESSSLRALQVEVQKDLLNLKEQFQLKCQALNQKVLELDAVTSYLHRILGGISHGILFIDTQGVITTCNPAAETILEVDRMDILFSPFWEHFKDDYFGFSLKKALKDKSSLADLHTQVQTSKGQCKELEIQTNTIYYETEKISNPMEFIQGIVILFKDLTEMRRLQRVAQQNTLLKEMGLMAASLAHEVRNPLGGIKGYASLLEQDLKGNPEHEKMIRAILKGTEDLNQLVTNILDYTRPLSLQLQKINLVDLIQELAIHVTSHPNGANSQLKVVAVPPQIVLTVDGVHLKRALLNLIRNSLDEMPNGGDVTVDIQKNSTSVIIQIQDEGKGISKEHLDKVFSPFFTTKVKGNGFGLSEVQKVIQAHQGTIEAAPCTKGAKFIIRLPLNLTTITRS